MPLPDGLQTVTVTFGPFTGFGGRPLRGETIFRASTAVKHVPSGTPLLNGPEVVVWDGAGNGSIVLPATDSTGMDRTGWTYTVTHRPHETGVPAPQGKTILLPAAVPVVDLEELVAATASGGVVVEQPAVTAVAGLSGAPTAQQIVDALDAPLRAAYGSRLPSPELASLALLERVRSHNDITSGNIGIIQVGSSVPHGDGIAPADNPAANKPGAWLTSQLNAKADPLGHLTFEFFDGSVPGSIAAAFFQQNDYADAKAALGYLPTVVIFGYGMNDGNATNYHGQQTLPGVYEQMRGAIEAVINDGGLPIVCTTPHPHSGRMDWTPPGGGVTYPASGQEGVPNDIINLTVNGVSIPVSYRHYRVNEAMRAAALANGGAVLLDVEKYWFEAVAAHGETALFDGAEYVHPNLLGMQLSYNRAITQFVDGLADLPAIVYAPARPPREITALKYADTVRNNTTAKTADPDLTFRVKEGKRYLARGPIKYFAAPGTDIQFNFTTPAFSFGDTGLLGLTDTVTSVDGSAISLVRPLATVQWLGGTGQISVARIEAYIYAGADGVVSFDWAQVNAAVEDTAIKAGSYLEVKEIG